MTNVCKKTIKTSKKGQKLAKKGKKRVKKGENEQKSSKIDKISICQNKKRALLGKSALFVE